MPHLSPMSWLLAIITFWTILMLFTSNIWWTNLHAFETDTLQYKGNKQTSWPWSLQDGWE
uniref:ATP synthase F0 subunit 8 n=1 Tax=Amynthas jiriensis TaxID=1820039 RepID=A0A142JA28_9ANNE|nr:ATP synthase F0 subunit 8 [Amynthas jiriensis]AMR74062.1 ATP synthase F0 subunit 8 [Amynthas jiriensis]